VTKYKRIIEEGVIGRNDFFAINPCVIWKGSDLNTSDFYLLNTLITLC
jgi:hypothetical protein